MKASQHLKGLYYFYVAARHLSIKEAAEKLFVTQAAVSQQIRIVEESLGVTLFYRQHRAIELTPEGEQLLPHLKIAFDALDQGVESVLSDNNSKVVTVSVLPSFASRWLIPRLGSFYETHPDIAVSLNMSDALDAFGPQGSDLAIRFGGGTYDGLDSQFLMSDYLYPVCHPSYLGSKKIKKVEDLQKLRLLEDATGNVGWDYWLGAKGYVKEKGGVAKKTVDSKEFSERISFDGSHYVIDSALSAQGVAMVRHCLVADAIQAGNLKPLFDDAVELNFKYFVCAPPHYLQRPKVIKFVEWLSSEVDSFCRKYKVNSNV